ncbi:MAG: hypothetical protein MZU97_12670 [Bacillus subtilis]|nr:hypothetical protein [Bacillus subtilis]
MSRNLPRSYAVTMEALGLLDIRERQWSLHHPARGRGLRGQPEIPGDLARGPAVPPHGDAAGDRGGPGRRPGRGAPHRDGTGPDEGLRGPPGSGSGKPDGAFPPVPSGTPSLHDLVLNAAHNPVLGRCTRACRRPWRSTSS